jgi:hypothetical protein
MRNWSWTRTARSGDRCPQQRCHRPGPALRLPHLHLRVHPQRCWPEGGGRGRGAKSRPKRSKGKGKGEKKSTASLTMDELRTKLEEALDNEDYEKASKIRDEIKKREGTNCCCRSRCSLRHTAAHAHRCLRYEPSGAAVLGHAVRSSVSLGSFSAKRKQVDWKVVGIGLAFQLVHGAADPVCTARTSSPSRW